MTLLLIQHHESPSLHRHGGRAQILSRLPVESRGRGFALLLAEVVNGPICVMSRKFWGGVPGELALNPD